LAVGAVIPAKDTYVPCTTPFLRPERKYQFKLEIGFIGSSLGA